MGLLVVAVILACFLIALLIAVPIILGSLIVAVLAAPAFGLAWLARRWRAARLLGRRPVAWAHKRRSIEPVVDLAVGDSMDRQLEEIRQVPEARELPDGRGSR
jgi:hypothetical protein